ncbi:MAG: trimeric intracellular cation channel family protein [Solirubrobacterales bacterium]
MLPVEPETLAGIILLLDLIGVAVFAISGALEAARRQMDPIGLIVIGTATGIGGGTLRDLVLGVRPVFWVQDQAFLVTCVLASVSVFWWAKALHSRFTLLVWLDAVGMAMFAVAGTQKALSLGAPVVVSALMGVMTASFGGLIRDVLCGEKPLIFHKEIYASAALVGAVAYLGLQATALSRELQTVLAFLAAFLVRAAAIRWGWSLPHYKADE